MPETGRPDGPSESARLPLYYQADGLALARRWSERFTLVPEQSRGCQTDRFALWASDDHLELRRSGDARGVWMRTADLQRRASGATELARACGLGRPHQAVGPCVLDAMAGWGLDGLLLARLGCRVRMVERHPLLQALLEDFVRRAAVTGVEARCGDGFDWLGPEHVYDIVYLDPMFPPRRKQALPGKRMQYLAELGVETDRPLMRWLQTALLSARDRVVIKRRVHDPVVAAADWQITGRAVRYDVYRGGVSA